MGNNQNEDYGDKGLDFLEKKTGHTMSRDTNEKITDGARGLFEKATGYVFFSIFVVLASLAKRWEER
ncbi:uncharacterized protein K444DRAFT_606590 [Hyaloscypha bicolor E]|uniref:Uncharacterized protein n=1 Tax=Hyaloscypha bicolor E TaxID=1095630 RepID=A0A2J6TXD1_9HELO|nr:uncharacterized protein K444DRAFT_606590 [Hyaloscypha bicolor E]PMD67690.1 hypothetical protein K444DRAFT_606590 [Hyaloscypha bicolor E]